MADSIVTNTELTKALDDLLLFGDSHLLTETDITIPRLQKRAVEKKHPISESTARRLLNEQEANGVIKFVGMRYDVATRHKVKAWIIA